MQNPGASPGGRRTLSFAAAVLIVLCGLVGLLAYNSYHANMAEAQQAIGRELRGIATAGSAGLDGDAFARLFASGSAVSPETLAQQADFQRLQRDLQRIIDTQSELGFNEENVYTFAFDPAAADRSSLIWAVMTHEQIFSGESYRARPEMLAVLDQSVASSNTGVYFSELSNHDWMSAYAPIRDSSGRIVGLLEIAWEVEQVLEQPSSSSTTTCTEVASVTTWCCVEPTASWRPKLPSASARKNRSCTTPFTIA